MSRIRDQYQAKDDEVVEYHPRALGLIDIPGTDGVNVTKTEAKLLDELTSSRGLFGLKSFSDLKDQVFETATQRYPDQAVPGNIPADRVKEWQGNDGHRDAFRHAYWNAMMTKEYGKEWAEQFATAHEGLPGNPATREAMDLYNNEVGRQIAIDHSDASPEELADLVQQAVTDGRMLVVDAHGQLARSNDVPLGQHGLTDDTVLPGQLAKPDGSASIH